MSWQLALTALVVGAAAVYVLQTVLRPILGRARSGCGSGCGKCATAEPPARPGRIRLPQLPANPRA